MAGVMNRLQPVVGAFEPWYCTISDPVTGYVSKAWWECPFCHVSFASRKACERHCKGKEGSHPPTDPVLKGKKTVDVELTPGEYTQAMSCAAKRTNRARQFSRVGQNAQLAADKPVADQRGCLGERAYCKWKNLPLSAMDFYPDDLRAEGYKPADFGPVDVKTKQKNGAYLLIQREDPREYTYVLASADVGDRVVTLCGWVVGTVAMTEEYWGDPRNTDRPCYWFPQHKLEPMSSLL